MLKLLVDTSTWLDLAKRRDGQKMIYTMTELIRDGELRLLVPPVVIEEFSRNRPRVESSITTSLADRLRSLRREVREYGGGAHAETHDALGELAHHAPLIGAMTTRNFDDIEELLKAGVTLNSTDNERMNVVQRGLEKRAPFHKSKNSVADALIIEGYATAVAEADLLQDPHAFVTTNHEDFSVSNGDRRLPHPDLAGIFATEGSDYRLGVDGLLEALSDYFGEGHLSDINQHYEFHEDPRRLDEIISAENDLFDRIWYHRSLQADIRWRRDGNAAKLKREQEIAGPARTRIEEKFEGKDMLGPYSDFELGMLNGKLSALRWVLGSEWDFLDT
ncbi:PIN domain-containing protein [Rhodococcus aetherivorans]|uniref:PIN domain-containing protein n=1 Tax=Rhodococcus aetherivorans TaxID=191292 RepID=UPI0029498E27|nr:PIN domain-containing protein [Rhodococcus aetherivorans]MDV6297339.1 PIN domain-containing protein [Rhodococcus aetherivorans]